MSKSISKHFKTDSIYCCSFEYKVKIDLPWCDTPLICFGEFLRDGEFLRHEIKTITPHYQNFYLNISSLQF